mmetsp:Transcript_73691/g.229880  ORF Transcript_73691/g.229880 Transcript_73691/m.229880 type:complete len:353 (-) Transcript_73691:154-1212(-)
MATGIKTPLTELLGIQHPVMLAGMGSVSSHELVAAVSNAGGIGTFGGVNMTVKTMRQEIKFCKDQLQPGKKFGVDLLLPQVGGEARKTNHDYTHGHLDKLLDVIIEEKVGLFVAAVGVPPKWAVDKLHAAGIPVMNMIGAPKHVQYAIDAGCDLICAQGGEGGGHTGDVATSILIPKVVDLCRGKTSQLTGGPVLVVAAGGIFDGRGLASALSMGAGAVWVGTRFVASEEAGAPPRHKQATVKAGYHDTIRTIIFTGRPMRVIKNDYIMGWEEKRANEIKELTSKGVLPVYHDMSEKKKQGIEMTVAQVQPMLIGQAAGAIDEVKPASAIMSEMISGAIECLRGATSQISKL